MRLLLCAAVVTVLAVPAEALAVERPCPEGQIWDLNRGACVKKKKVKRRSPEEKYYAALEHLEGRAKNPDPAKAIDLLEDACGKKLGMACTQLGFVHLRGRGGIEADAGQAITFYDRACTLGDLDGCIGAAEMHASGVVSGKVEHEKAVPLLDRACKAGSGRACHLLAGKYDFALGVAEDKAKAAALYTKAFGMLEAECGKGVGASCDLVGVMYRDGSGVAYDIAKAVAAFGKGCDGGAGDACYHLGLLTHNGTGVAADLPAAYALYEKACLRYDHADGCFEAGAILALDQLQGDLAKLEPMAQRACTLSRTRCDLLGYIISNGRGVREDKATGLGWYDVACADGNGLACYWLGVKYANGEGIAASATLAVTAWEKGCELSEASSCALAGKYHFWGDEASGLAKTPARAFELFHLGCLRNDHESCEWAGELLNDGTDGTGVPNPTQAILYFEAGCSLGRGQSCGMAGDAYRDGKATGTVDLARAVDFYQQSCWATIEFSSYGCRQAAGYLRAGEAPIKKDLLTAARAMTAVCRAEGGDDCLTADEILGEAGADDATKQALVEAITSACEREPRLENACVAHALLLRNGGASVGKNEKASAKKLGESCDRGYLHACWLQGLAYQAGWGFVADPQTATLLFTRACDGGHNDACVSLAGLMSEAGKRSDALGIYQRACDDGHASACNGLGFAYYTAGGVRWDIAEANRLYERGCELGDSIACSNVGEMYEYGISREADAAKAYQHYRKACDMGFQGACGRAAPYHERGEGGAEKDLELAEQLYTAGCEADTPEACRRLADLLTASKKGSASRIAQLYQRAFASAKDQSATNPYYMWVLGTFHRDGVATVKDPKVAAELFVKACEGYDPLACLDAGRMYLGEPGSEGLEPNPEIAAVTLDKACAANVVEACTLAAKARSGGTKVPMAAKKGSGCACDAGERPEAGGLLLLALVGLLARRRRR